ncbi:coiled-coil domain-containing protein 106-like [Nothobranchius furzeri]|uniref:coiled-coil domain-containing protein 106-like n=1 Tax=Nothobranchius furzeri TaxID=105023 RepID=UPI0024047C63|nr:coiled-coil domain-containing protein 106-like [Nothobranchius furzeri]
MDGPEEKDSCSTATPAVSTRSKKNKKQRLDNVNTKPTLSTEKRDDTSSGLAPTATVLLNKERQEVAFLKEKLEWQKMRIEELEGERDFLRSQLSSLSTQPKDEPLNDTFINNPSENLDSSSTSSSASSEWSSSSSSSPPKKQKRKFKNKHSKAKKYKKEEKKFRQRVRTPSEIVQRYKSLLKTFPKMKTLSKAFQKHGIDRNTVVSTASVAELAIAAPLVYQELISNKPSGETVLHFAKRCEEEIQSNDEVKNKIESMKADGTLLPIRRGKSV